MASEIAGYPAHREGDVVLRDGSTVHVRPLRPDDGAALLDFLRRLSPDSRAQRFHSAGPDLEGAVARATDVDWRDRSGLVALAGIDGRIVGHAGYRRIDGERAEVGFTVADAFQGRGLGTILLAHLAEMAAESGIGTFEAEVAPANLRMLEVFRESGFPLRTRAEPGIVRTELGTSFSPEARERFDRREQIAALAAMRAFFRPRSVAVLGASRSRGTIGGEIFHNLLATGFQGPVYPVNPRAPVVQSVAAYRSVLDVPGPVDLAVVVVPAREVLGVARECAAKGARALVVISAGFAEIGGEGTERQRALLEVCRAAGMRLVGPNCMGVLDTAPEVRLNATFSPAFPPHGRVGFLSQSGALGLAVIDHASGLGLGLSSFASVGNKADISANDLLQYWEEDPGTDLILLYLESFGNPVKFARIARRVGKRKPIVAVKSGRSAAGARAAGSHTGALVAASDVTVDAFFRQAGVIRTDTLGEMFDVASLLANQPVPAGPRVGIVSNAGGPAILCADACEAVGLEVVAFPEEVRTALAGFLPAEASVGNPVDMIASASAEDFRRAIEVVAESGSVDAVVVIFIPPIVTRREDVARAIRDAARGARRKVPFLAVFMSARGVPEELRSEEVRIPSYAFPEDAARALGRAAEYGAWRRRPDGSVPAFPGARRDEAAALLAGALAGGSRWLPPAEAFRLLDCYGLPLVPWRLAPTPEAAGRAAEEIGGEVALKAVAPTLLHKTEAGGVRLSLRAARETERAATEMAGEVERHGHRVEAFLVQRMAPKGVEMIVGVIHDPHFGPVVACGAGGTSAEVLRDVAVRITPLTDLDAGEMVRSLATFPLLEGWRGAPRADVRALEEVVLRVGALVASHPEVGEMDLNPVVDLPEGALVVDARVRVETPVPRAPVAARERAAGSP